MSDAPAAAEVLGLSETGRRLVGASLMPRLAAWRSRVDADATSDAWRYDEQWEPVADLAPQPARDRRGPRVSWLVSDDAPHDPAVGALADSLAESGVKVERWTVRQAFERLAARSGPLAASLVYLPRAVAPGARGVGDACSPEALVLAQCVCASTPAVRLWIVTPHVLRVYEGDEPVAPAMMTLWGLGRTLALERRESFGALVDVPAPPADDAALRALASLLSRTIPPAEGDELAFRRGGWFVRRLARANVLPPRIRWRPRGAALVTGGTGALGVHVARYLAAQGCEAVVPARAPAPRRRAATSPASSNVGVARCASRPAMCATRSLSTWPSRSSPRPPAGHPALRHVVHTAGVPRWALLDLIAPETWRSVLDAKVRGAYAPRRRRAPRRTAGDVRPSTVRCPASSAIRTRPI